MIVDVGDAGTSFRRLHNNLSLSSSTSIFSSILWWCQFNVQTQQQLVLCYVQCQQSQNRVENTEYLLCADGDFYFVSDISMTQVSKEEELERAIKSSRIDQES